MSCDVFVLPIFIFKKRVTCTNVFGLILLDTASVFLPPDAISVGIIQETQLCAQGEAVLTVCLRPTVHVPSPSLSFVTATKHLLTPPSRVSFDRITLAHKMQEFLMFYGFVDYYNFCVNKSSPFVPVLSPLPNLCI